MDLLTVRQASLIVVCVLLGALGGLLLKAGAVKVDYSKDFVATAVDASTQPQILAGVLLYALPLVGYVVLLKSVPLSVLQPILALTYVVTPLFGRIALDEPVPATRWVGIGVIVVGVAIVGTS